MSNDELLTAAQAGDTSAINTLIESFEPTHHAIARRIVGHSGKYAEPANLADVRQAARQGTLLAVQQFQPKEGGVALATFVHRYAYSYAIREFRRASSALLATSTEWEFDEPETERLPSEDVSPETAVARRNFASKVHDLVDASDILDDLDRDIWTRRLLRHKGDRDFLRVLGAEHGVTDERVRQREAILRDELLPKVLGSLKDAL